MSLFGNGKNNSNVDNNKGQNLQSQSQQSLNQSDYEGPLKRCKKCGKMIPAKSKRCPFCNKKQKGKAGLIIGIIILLFILIGVFGSGGKDNNKDERNNNSDVNKSSQSSISEPAETVTDNNDSSEMSEAIEEESKDNSIYSNVEIVDLMNGTGTEKIGTISIAHADQSACTEDALLDWYFNYVLKNNDCNYHIIVYNEDSEKGVYSSGAGFIQKDIALTPDENGTYMLGDDNGSTYYTVDSDAKSLSTQAVMADAEFVENVKTKIDEVIPDDYKGGELYAIDVAGEEGNLDCYITIVNPNFSDADYQSITKDLATQIKELDLGIGYFTIAFQSDDYTLNALSGLDNLSSQDVSEITTQEF